MFFKHNLYFYSLICVFVLLLGCTFILFGAFGTFLVSCILFMIFVGVKSYYEKNNKKFKTALMTSFILLLMTLNMTSL